MSSSTYSLEVVEWCCQRGSPLKRDGFKGIKVMNRPTVIFTVPFPFEKINSKICPKRLESLVATPTNFKIFRFSMEESQAIAIAYVITKQFILEFWTPFEFDFDFSRKVTWAVLPSYQYRVVFKLHDEVFRTIFRIHFHKTRLESQFLRDVQCFM